MQELNNMKAAASLIELHYVEYPVHIKLIMDLVPGIRVTCTKGCTQQVASFIQTHDISMIYTDNITEMLGISDTDATLAYNFIYADFAVQLLEPEVSFPMGLSVKLRTVLRFGGVTTLSGAEDFLSGGCEVRHMNPTDKIELRSYCKRIRDLSESAALNMSYHKLKQLATHCPGSTDKVLYGRFGKHARFDLVSSETCEEFLAKSGLKLLTPNLVFDEMIERIEAEVSARKLASVCRERKGECIH